MYEDVQKIRSSFVNVVHINSTPSTIFIARIFCNCGGSDGKVSACDAGDLDSIPGLGRSPGEENGKPL